jgi:hypothetical protein
MGGTGSGRKRKQPDTLLNSGSIAYFWAPDRAAASVNVEAKNATADEQPPSEAGEDISRVAELVAEQQLCVRAKLQQHFNVDTFPYGSVF